MTCTTSDAAANTNEEIRVLRLELAHAPQVVKDALLRLFADRARVEYDDVGVVRTVRQRKPVFSCEDVGDARRVVLVHLAAERPDIELASHARDVD